MDVVYFIFDSNWGNFSDEVFLTRKGAEIVLEENQKLNRELYGNRYNWQIIELRVKD